MFYNHDYTDSPAIAKLEALHAAERRLLNITLRIAGGRTRYAFPRHNADAAIAHAVGEVERYRHEFDRALASDAAGEPYRLPPSAAGLKLALQNRVTRNEADRGIGAMGPVLFAARQVDAADAAEISLTEVSRERGRSLADLDAGFASPAGE
ncbi:hypothetical protein DK389_28905 [Methylobacterium durans]|uniref:Uncharacterized protein n=2 Tax=Methylobacterium durans TaxID=2202825 RepID=A0A2U8WC95_9HYPH|nr:hypothetical protein DK389_28905 [Methylobacterium durans]